MNRYLLALVASMISYGFAHGDTVVVENGDVLTGKVDSIAGGRLVLSTTYAGNVVIDMAAIRQLETEGSYNLRLRDKRLVGRLSVVEGMPVVATKMANIPYEIIDLRVVSQSNLAVSSLASEWNSRVDLALALSSGNSTAESFNTLIESDFKQDKTAHKITLLVNTEDSEGLKTKDQLDFDYGFKLFLSDQWFSAANAEYFSDPIKDVDQRISVGIGAGYQFVDNSFGALSTELGLSAVQEQLDGDDEVNPAIRWGVDYNRYFLAKSIELFHRQSLLIIPDDDRGQVLSSSTGVRFALNHRIDTAFRVDLNYETDPIPGNEKADTTYTLGLGVRF
jgi:putative salt-induced outer membrane protein YdiY|tara:strand:- start:2486 stop:3490 length:1005 start_codon:yes stop_codon:yes gene_type:complete